MKATTTTDNLTFTEAVQRIADMLPAGVLDIKVDHLITRTKGFFRRKPLATTRFTCIHTPWDKPPATYTAASLEELVEKVAKGAPPRFDAATSAALEHAERALAVMPAAG